MSDPAVLTPPAPAPAVPASVIPAPPPAPPAPAPVAPAAAPPSAIQPPADATKPAAVVPPTTEQPKAPPAAPAPVDYSKLTLPKDSPLLALNPKAAENVAAFAKERNLSLESAQMILDRDNASVAAARQAQELQSKTWYGELEKDPEVGGANLGKNGELVKRLLEKHDTDGVFRKEVMAMRLENNPTLFRLLARIAGASAEDKLVTGGRPSGTTEAKKSPAQIMYPNNPSAEGVAG